MASSLTISGLANYFEPVGGPADSTPFSTVLIKDPLHTHDDVLVSVTLGTVSPNVPADSSLSGLLFSTAGAFDESLTFYRPPVFTSTMDTITFTDFTTGTVLGSETITLCFLRGTRILTPAGEVAVENLSPGDLVITLSGAHRALRWIGTGRALVTEYNHNRASPVVVRRNALAEGVPHRDLYLTRGHSLFFDGVLISVEELVNHRSIAWVEQRGAVEYYHLEVDDHDVILAEGAPAETYRDDGNSSRFENIADETHD